MFIFALIIKLNMEYKRKYVSELKALSQEFADLPHFDKTKLSNLKAKAKSCIRSAFVDSPEKLIEVGKISFLSLYGHNGTYDDIDVRLWDKGKTDMSALLGSYAKELENIIEDEKFKEKKVEKFYHKPHWVLVFNWLFWVVLGSILSFSLTYLYNLGRDNGKAENEREIIKQEIIIENLTKQIDDLKKENQALKKK